MLLFKSCLFITREKNIRQINELKIIASTWNDEFETPGGSYSASDYSRLYGIYNQKARSIKKKFVPLIFASTESIIY